ncbi:30S ribosomal protein S21 [Psychrobacter sp.]|uniref:30S ribosomal protein S21 n=1 Tax=Psychrobacter sp. TaxID=56811 RepID=UPI0035670568
MPAVKVKENEPVDIAIRRFKRACEKAGVLSDVRKRKKAAAVKRYKKKLQRETIRTTRMY